MDHLIGRKNIESGDSDLPEQSGDRLLNPKTVVKNFGELTELDENILSQSLDIQDWLKHMKETQAAPPPPPPEVVHRTKGERQSGISRFFKKITNKVNDTVTLEVLDVVNLCLSNSRQFWGGWLDCPQPGNTLNGYVIYVSGWVLGKKSKVVSVRASVGGALILEIPVNVPRPGVPETYFFLEDILVCGYAETIYLIEQPTEGRLELKAIFEDGETAPIGAISYCKY